MLYFVFAPKFLSRYRKSVLSSKTASAQAVRLLHSADFAIALSFLVLALLMANGNMKNAVQTGQQINFYGTAGIEGLWHLGNAAYMKKSFDFADIHHNGFKYAYHIFIYIFIALASNLLHLELSELFFKFLPVYLLFFLLITAYVTGGVIFKRRMAGLIAALCLLFLDDTVVELGPRLLSLQKLHGDFKRTDRAIVLLWLCSAAGIGSTLLFVPPNDPYSAMYFHRFGAVCLAFLLGRTLAVWLQ